MLSHHTRAQSHAHTSSWVTIEMVGGLGVFNLNRLLQMPNPRLEMGTHLA